MFLGTVDTKLDQLSLAQGPFESACMDHVMGKANLLNSCNLMCPLFFNIWSMCLFYVVRSVPRSHHVDVVAKPSCSFAPVVFHFVPCTYLMSGCLMSALLIKSYSEPLQIRSHFSTATISRAQTRFVSPLFTSLSL